MCVHGVTIPSGWCRSVGAGWPGCASRPQDALHATGTPPGNGVGRGAGVVSAAPLLRGSGLSMRTAAAGLASPITLLSGHTLNTGHFAADGGATGAQGHGGFWGRGRIRAPP